jgi:hypothetical protein
MPSAWSWSTWLTLHQGRPAVKRMFDTHACAGGLIGVARPAYQGGIGGQKILDHHGLRALLTSAACTMVRCVTKDRAPVGQQVTSVRVCSLPTGLSTATSVYSTR